MGHSPIMNAYQAVLPQEEEFPWDFPLTPKNQAYLITGCILTLMVLVIIRSSQLRDK